MCMLYTLSLSVTVGSRSQVLLYSFQPCFISLLFLINWEWFKACSAQSHASIHTHRHTRLHTTWFLIVLVFFPFEYSRHSMQDNSLIYLYPRHTYSTVPIGPKVFLQWVQQSPLLTERITNEFYPKIWKLESLKKTIPQTTCVPHF